MQESLPIDREGFFLQTSYMQGKIIAGSNNVFEVEDAAGLRYACSIKGKILKEARGYYNPLAPGDLVQIEKDTHSENAGQIIALLPRRNAFARWNVKGRAPQLLAANIDVIVVVTSSDEPPFRPRFIDRALVQAEQAGIEAVILCNKIDLPKNAECEKRLEDWSRIGYKIFRCSTKTKEGLASFAQFLLGKRNALMGQSGVGKSSLINALDEKHALQTSMLSEKYGRGVHTTTQGVLLHLDLSAFLPESVLEPAPEPKIDTTIDTIINTKKTSSLAVQKNAVEVIDTPGIRRFVLSEVEDTELALYFREIANLVGTCKFGLSCKHETEPDCAIIQAVEEGRMSPERYENYLRIADEIKTDSWED